MSINNFSIPLEVFDPDQLSTALKESKSPVVPLKEQIKK
ncbi:MAG: hypothetical protein ACI89U_002630, partial [Gammaproteobacteria bacterium]